MTSSGFGCHVCGAEELAEVAEYRELPRVTSDCKPYPAGGRIAVCMRCGAIQKPADAKWREEVSGIYRDYTIYFQSNGVEQSVFDAANGQPRLRSEVLLDRVNATRALLNAGKVIDIGCGKGTFLTALSRMRPRWKLIGHELNRSTEDVLKRIAGFERLYTGPFAELPDQFDLVTLIHALEHFEAPYEGLRDLATKLAPDGLLVIEVPNGAASPFDIVVADHASHFTRADLAHLVGRCGLSPLALADDWIAKELSVVAARSPADVEPAVRPDPESVRMSVSRRIRWLRSVIDQARLAQRNADAFGIFGTSVASMWLYGELGEDTAFFVDEDPARVGTLHGRPVLSPDRIPAGSTVYLALLPEVAAHVASRIGRSDIRLELPPRLP